MAKIKLKKLSMYYEIHGSGIPIVFIAGFSADHTTWNEIVDKFKHRYQVILFDNRGAGQSDIIEKPYLIKDMADDVAEFCQTLGIHQAHFVGSSMGGFILQSLAFHYPKLIKSAVISNSPAAAETPFHFYVAAQLELLKAKAPPKAMIKAACAWLFSFQFLAKPGVLDFLIQLGLNNPYPFTIKGYEGQYSALQQFDSKAWLDQLNVPTLVLTSDQDLVFSQQSVKWLANQIPNAEHYSFTSCGHLPHLECPDQFTRVVQAFIEKFE